MTLADRVVVGFTECAIRKFARIADNRREKCGRKHVAGFVEADIIAWHDEAAVVSKRGWRALDGSRSL